MIIELLKTRCLPQLKEIETGGQFPLYLLCILRIFGRYLINEADDKMPAIIDVNK